MFIKTKKWKEKKKALHAQVDWYVYLARQAYIDGDAYMCIRHSTSAAEVQDSILRMYPRYQKPIKTKRTIFVPVSVPSRQAIEVEQW